MPLLNIVSSNSVSDGTLDSFLAAASVMVSSMLGKSEKFVMINYQHNPDRMFAGSNTASAYVELKSLDLDESKTTHYSSEICQLCQNHLNVSTDRIYIEFTNGSRHLWGWNNKTF